MYRLGIIVLFWCSLVVLAALLTNCQTIAFENDFGFTASAQANSHEYLVMINETVCKDAEGRVGACAIRVKSDAVVRFRQDPRPYPHSLKVRCSAGLDADFERDYPPAQGVSWQIRPEQFARVKFFTCVGEITPLDRDEQRVSAGWHARIIVVDESYQGRSDITPIKRDGKSYLVMGRYALHSTLCRAGAERCSWHNEETVLEAEWDAQTYSESFMMRFNYYGF